MTQEATPGLIAEFYDANVTGKLDGFVDGNPRVERAWETVERWAASKNPRRVLELGCAIGDICWRMSRLWPEAEIVGLDVSPKSIEIANKLFGSPTLTFIEGTLTSAQFSNKFDLIIMLDVYEHIPASDRPALHAALSRLLSPNGQIILSFPTPEHLAWLREHHPEQIQPVDEDVSVPTILALASDTATEVALFQKVGVWYEGDYAHAVVSQRRPWTGIDESSPSMSLGTKVRKFLALDAHSVLPARAERLARVRERLGAACYPAK